MRLENGPLFLLAGIRKQKEDDGASPRRFLERKEGLARKPAVVERGLPAAALMLAQADDDVQSAVAEIERLVPALCAVAQHGKRFSAKYCAHSVGREVTSLDDRLGWTARDLDLAHGRFSTRRGAVPMARAAWRRRRASLPDIPSSDAGRRWPWPRLQP